MTTAVALAPTPEYEDALAILLAVWRAINWDGMAASRRMGIYDEFQAQALYIQSLKKEVC